LEKDAVEGRLERAARGLANDEPQTNCGLGRAMHFDLAPAPLGEHGPDRAGRQLRRIAIPAEMTEHDSLEFPGEQLFDHGGSGGVRQMAVARLDPLFYRPRPMRIGLQHFLVVVRLDHERVHFAQPLDHHLRRVSEIGDEPERALTGMKRVTDRIDRVMRNGKSLDMDIANREIRAGLEEPPVFVFA
jgi:hypothetical protein